MEKKERSIARNLYEMAYATGTLDSKDVTSFSAVTDGIRRRAEWVLVGDTSDTGVFSESAAPVLRRVFGDIVIRNGVVTVHPAKNDPYGYTLSDVDRDGNVSMKEVPRGSTLLVRRSPVPLIPIPSINPAEVQEKALRGELKFELLPTKTMAIAVYRCRKWEKVGYYPRARISIDPTSDRYGQDIFGGNRAVRLNDGRIALFRPHKHADRFWRNAKRLRMPSMSVEELVDIYRQVVRANKDYLPDNPSLGSLYIAPGFRASGGQIGVKPNEVEYMLTCIATPAGKIFSRPAKLKVERKYHRVVEGGIGNVKTGANYAPMFRAKMEAIEEGYDDIIALDPTDTKTTELSSSNIFFVKKDGTLVTPTLDGLILDGITRDSILTIARKLGITIEERSIPPEEYGNFAEAFSSGTGVTMNGIAQIDNGKHKYHMNVTENGMGSVTKRIYQAFMAILAGRHMDDSDYGDWLVIVE